MPEILFDGRQVAVPEDTNLVEAGLEAGVPVPVFCYHKDLGPVGACRVCAVTVARGGKSRMVMACMTAAEEGMEVTTLDPASVVFRKRVLEWLMLSHPHDCPICDEGGECQLQDLTIAAGHSQRRYRGRKRTFDNQYLGEFIAHEMNRCITCYRCSRFYQEVAGGRDFGPSGSRDRVYFGRFEDGPLESPFSGNLVEMCPTGVFTDKLFRYRSRVWDLDLAPSICPHCSVGCNVLPGVRYREVQRIRVRENRAVNGPFLCDRGQFGHRWSVDPARPRQPRLGEEPMDWDSALGAVGAQLLAIARTHGSASVALLTSSRASLETHAALRALASGPLEGARIAHFDDPQRERRSLAAIAALATAKARMLDAADLPGCDALLVAGTSLVDEAPLMALMARQVARNGGQLFTIGPIERSLRDVANKVVSAHPAHLGEALLTIAGESKIAPEGVDGAALGWIGAALGAAARPGVLLGHDLMDGPAFAAGAALAQGLAERTPEARFGCLFGGPNGFGAALLTERPALEEILSDIEHGAIKAALVVESDLDDLGEQVRAALARLELLVLADHVSHELAGSAHAVLPTTTTYESEGIYVNRAGRIQAFAAAAVAGVPVTRLIQHETFPRQPRLDPPGGEARAAWWVLEQLRPWSGGAPRPRSLLGLRQSLAEQPVFAGLLGVCPGDSGQPIESATLRPQASDLPAFSTNGHSVHLFRLDRTLGSEPLSRRSEPMQRMAGAPKAWLAPQTGPDPAGTPARIAVRLDGRVAELEAVSDPTVPEGVILVPRDVRWPRTPLQGAAVELAVGAEVGR
jgi:NADH-quinone oxidoreductase subunit G